MERYNLAVKVKELDARGGNISEQPASSSHLCTSPVSLHRVVADLTFTFALHITGITPS
jgi:hypothetical protein